MRDMLFWAVILAVQYVLYVRVARPETLDDAPTGVAG